jgi:dipeptidase E
MRGNIYRWRNTFIGDTTVSQVMSALSRSTKKEHLGLGTSAGSVIRGLSMQNTNDMPII